MTKISAADFVKKHPKTGKTSKLEPYRDDILFLKSKGYTQMEILDFLKMNGVDAGMTTLNWFIRSRSGKSAAPATASAPAAQQTKAEIQEHTDIPTKPEKQETPPANTDADNARTFDWQKQPTREELFGTITKEQADNVKNGQKQDGERIPVFEWKPGEFDIDNFVG